MDIRLGSALLLLELEPDVEISEEKVAVDGTENVTAEDSLAGIDAIELGESIDETLNVAVATPEV